MATPRKPAVVTEPAGGTPPPETPSFAALAHPEGTPPPATEPQPVASAPPPSSEPFDFDKWYKAQPKEAISEYEKRLTNFVNHTIDQQYGDIMPAVLEIAADPDSRKRLARLANKDERAFALQRALDIWDEQQQRGGEGAPQPADATTKRVDALESQLSREREQREYDEYVRYRQGEMAALLNEQPSLRYTTPESREYKYMAYLQDQAHAMSIRYNRFVSLKEIYDNDRAIHNAPVPPSIPSTTQSEVGSAGPNAAPANEVEVRQRMATQLKKAGGFRALAEASRRK